MMEVASSRARDGTADGGDNVVIGGDAQSTKRGVKRHASLSDLSDEQRFTKRFNLLTLGKQSHHDSDPYTARSSHAYIPLQDGQPAPASPRLSDNVPGSSMDVDDTKDRIFIGDLDAEIADIDAHQPEERLIFLPDIEKHFSRLPRQVLVGNTSDQAQSTPADQQLVLYSVPQSLTVDHSNNDAVRRAIIDARHRARDRAQELAREEDMRRKYASPDDSEHAVETAHGYGAGYVHEPDIDTDAMDIE